MGVVSADEERIAVPVKTPHNSAQVAPLQVPTRHHKKGAADDDEEAGITDIAEQFQVLVNQLINDKVVTAAGVENPIGTWRRQCLRGVEDPRVLSFFTDALPTVVARLVELEQNFRVAQKRNVIGTVLLTFFDTLSDYSAFLVLYSEDSSYAAPMLAVMVVSLLTQALGVRYVTKEGPLAAFGALCGLKPIIDGIHIVFNIPNQPGALRPQVAFTYTRGIETSTESIPFAFMQALALVEQRSVAQWISFGISVFNIAHAVASIDYDIDKSAYYRRLEPLLYGCYPLEAARRDTLLVSIGTFAVGYVTCKILAVALLGTVSPISLMLGLLIESTALLLVRFAIGNWRYFNHAGDSAPFSIIFCHFALIYPMLIAAPLPILRHPFFCTPLVYSGFIVWTLFLANPLMLALAFRFDPAGINPQLVWMVLGNTTALCVMAALVASMLVEPAFRGTYYRHMTMSMYIRDFYWVRSTKFDGQPVASNDDLDAIRASVLNGYSTAYWPMDLARQWVRNGWSDWLTSSPEWFTERWRAHIPKEWFSGSGVEDDSIVVSMTRQERKFRSSIGATAPWNLNGRAFTAFLDEHFINSVVLPPASGTDKTKRQQLVHQFAGADGIRFLERCCTSHTQSPWVQISHAENGEVVHANDMRVAHLTSTLCDWGLQFYYQLFIASASHSPLHGYQFVRTIQRQEHYELMLVCNRQTEQLDVLTLTSFEKLDNTQMAIEKKTLSDIQKACDTSEFVASLYHWGANGSAVFIVGEYCGGGTLTKRIEPNIGIENDEEFWRLACQLTQGMADIHGAGLTHLEIWVRVARTTRKLF